MNTEQMIGWQELTEQMQSSLQKKEQQSDNVGMGQQRVEPSEPQAH